MGYTQQQQLNNWIDTEPTLINIDPILINIDSTLINIDPTCMNGDIESLTESRQKKRNKQRLINYLEFN